MAIPGYHDPVYNPVMVTGEATPEDNSLEAMARKLAAAIKSGGSLDFLANVKGLDPEKMAKVTRVAKEMLNFGTKLKSNYPSAYPFGAEPNTNIGLMAQSPKRGVGLGDIFPGTAVEAWQREASGNSAFGNYGKIPFVPKPGRSGDVLDMLGTLPLGTGLGAAGEAPAMIGAIRRASDKVSPGVGRSIAEQLWQVDNPLWAGPVDEFGGRRNVTADALRQFGPPTKEDAEALTALSANAALPDLQKGFGEYFARYAGMPDDPLRKLPLFKRHNPTPNSQFYTEDDLGAMPLRVAKPYEALPDPYAIGPARDQRPELEFPPTTSAASGSDDLMGASLNKSDEALKNIKAVEPYLVQDPEELDRDLQRLRGLMTAVTRDPYYANEYLSEEAVRGALKTPQENLKKMGLTPGKVDEFLQEMGAADPTARMAAPVDLDYDHLGGAAYTFVKSLQSQEFRDYVATLPPEYVKSKPFHTIYEGFAAKTRNDFLTWKQKQVPPPVPQALNPETGKPAPLGVWPGTTDSLFPPDHGWYRVTPDQVLYEGTSLNHCIGKESHGHPRNIREGKEFAYSFRTGDNKPLMTIAVYPQRDGSFDVAEIKAINNQQPHNVQDRRLPVEAKAFIDKMGFRLGDNYDDARFLHSVMARIEQNPDYIRERAAPPTQAADNPELSENTLKNIASLFTDYKVEKMWGRDVAVPKDPGRGPIGYTREKDLSPGAERWEIGLLDLENPGDLTPMSEGTERVFKTEIAKFLGGAKEPSPRIQNEIINRAKLEDDWAAGRIELRPGWPQGQTRETFAGDLDPYGVNYIDNQGVERRTSLMRLYNNALGPEITYVAYDDGKLWSVSPRKPTGFDLNDKKKGLYWIRPVKYREMTQEQHDYLVRHLRQ